MQSNYLFYSICEIEEDIALEDPAKSLYFLCKCFFYVLQKKHRNEFLSATHDCYFLFNIFSSWVNNLKHFF